MPPRKRIPAVVVAGERRRLIESERKTIAALARIDPEGLVVHASLADPPAESVPLVVGEVEVYLPLEGLVDTVAEKARLSSELGNVQAQITRLETLLGGAFAERAPAEVVEKERAKLAELKQAEERIRSQLEGLGA